MPCPDLPRFLGIQRYEYRCGSHLGFYLPDNFYFPYRSLSVTEFWHRWHISLSFWFRDYVYIPLGGNRKGKVRMCFNNFLTMLVAGYMAWLFLECSLSGVLFMVSDLWCISSSAVSWA
ncbi:MAG: MBOAT family O-acyltransferase [Segatella copri]